MDRKLQTCGPSCGRKININAFVPPDQKRSCPVTGQLADGLPGWLDGWPASWLAGGLSSGWLAGWLVGWAGYRLAGWLAGSLGWLAGWLAGDRLLGMVPGCLAPWLAAAGAGVPQHHPRAPPRASLQGIAQGCRGDSAAFLRQLINYWFLAFQ